MKKNTILIFALLISVSALSQDSRLYGEWSLFSITPDFGEPFYVDSVDPPISPWVTIAENLDFNGLGVCNEFSGNFEYISETDLLNQLNFSSTDADCGDNFLNNVELVYFEFFEFPPNLDYFFFIDNDGTEHLKLQKSDFSTMSLDFLPRTLSTNDFSKNGFKIFPNPVSNELFISAENLQITEISIYSISGQLIFKSNKDESSVDVSALKNGIYFIEITSDQGKMIKKFIKE